MKTWNLFASIFQIVIGVAAIAAYIVLSVGEEPLGKWTVTLILAIAFVVLGVIGLVDWIRSRKRRKDK